MADTPRFTTIIKTDKGLKGGSCNRRACQAPGATWWNPHSHAYYCTPCAHLLNREFDKEGIARCARSPQEDTKNG